MSVVLFGCSWDWDAFDPRLGESATSRGAGGAGGAPPGNGGASASSVSTGGSGGAVVTTYREVVLADGPVGYWRFGEPLAASTALDETTSGLSGTYLGGVTLGDPGALAGDPDPAAHFDGIDDQVEFGDVLDFPGLDAHTVEAWIRPDSNQLNTYGIVCAKQLDANDGFEFGIVGASGTVYFGREVGGAAGDAAVTMVPFDEYSHVVGTFDGTSLRIYLNGVEVDVVASALLLPDTAAQLTAGNSYLRGEFWSGALDELAIYDKALSEARIAAHYAAGIAR